MPLISIKEKFVMFGTIISDVKRTPATEPTVLKEKTKPEIEFFPSDDWLNKAIRIGLSAERKTSGKASRIKLPIKLPNISPNDNISGNSMGYNKQDKKIKKTLSIGSRTRNNSLWAFRVLLAIHPPIW